MSFKESELAAQSTLIASDLIRIVANASSRKINVTDFAKAIQPFLETEGFLTNDNLPVDVTNKRNYVIKTVNYNISTVSDDIIFADASGSNITITLPDASTAFTPATGGNPAKGQFFTIKRVDSTVANKVIVASAGGTIDGLVNVDLFGNKKPYFNAISDGTNWLSI